MDIGHVYKHSSVVNLLGAELLDQLIAMHSAKYIAAYHSKQRAPFLLATNIMIGIIIHKLFTKHHLTMTHYSHH